VRSLDWHEAYHPDADDWETLAPVPGPRDHTAAVVVAGSISVVGGRMDTFDFNTGCTLSTTSAADRWQERAPMSTPRSGHGGVLYRGKLFCMGGEGTRRVFGQLEAYDPQADSWQAYARHDHAAPRHGRRRGGRRHPRRRRRPHERRGFSDLGARGVQGVIFLGAPKVAITGRADPSWARRDVPKQTSRPINSWPLGWSAGSPRSSSNPDKQLGTSLVICGRHCFQTVRSGGDLSRIVRTLVPRRFGDLRYPTFGVKRLLKVR